MGGKCHISFSRNNVCTRKTPLHPKRHPFAPKFLPFGNKKAVKPNFQPDSGDYQFLGPAAWPHVVFPFSSLQIKLFWPSLLESTSDICPSRTMDPHHHLSFPEPQNLPIACNPYFTFISFPAKPLHPHTIHMWKKACYTCLCETDLYHWTIWFPVLHRVHICCIFFIHLLKGI
jgi:hypothetical protein